jgi:galactokinase
VAAQEVVARFRDQFGVAPELVASAPGRVNLVGEHTDYNDGFVLPMAIDRRTRVAASRRSDGVVQAYASDADELVEIDLDAPASGRRRWTDYVAGMIRVMRESGYPAPGMNLYVDSTVPIGAGLSSSAALEVALARAIATAGGGQWDAAAMARLAQRVEHEFVGVRCGIMDQLIAACGRPGTALLIDCRSLGMRPVAVPDAVAIVVMDTGVRRSLSATDYNARRTVCEYVVGRVRSLKNDVRALRDVQPALLETARMLLDDTAYRRAKHVVEENARPAALAIALGAGDYARAGAILDASHASLRDLYEVSSVQLDLICEEARAHAACFGARMTGAGFGGCAIALVRREGAADFIARVQPRYEARSYQRSDFFLVRPDEGARLDPVS